jgi:hypothetical protein
LESRSLPSREQDVCRISIQIFLLREVFNTSVDKFVEKLASSAANYTLLSILTRFAQFRCKYLARAWSRRESPLSNPEHNDKIRRDPRALSTRNHIGRKLFAIA